MRFLKFLLKEVSYNPSKKEMKSAVDRIVRRKKVKANKLSYIGAEDYGDLGALLYFNIEDHNHPDFGTTVAEKV